MIDENLMVAVGELVQAYLNGANGQDQVYMDTASGRFYWLRWEDCVLDGALYYIFSWGWRPDEMPAASLVGIVDECTVQVAGGEYDGCWYCDVDRLADLLEEYDEEQKAVMGDE